jgi:hypothetical protein
VPAGHSKYKQQHKKKTQLMDDLSGEVLAESNIRNSRQAGTQAGRQ